MLTLRKNSLKYKDENGVMQDSGVLFSSGATEVDTTLSKSGMAADAKTVGDELVKLSEEIVETNSNVSIIEKMLALINKIINVDYGMLLTHKLINYRGEIIATDSSEYKISEPITVTEGEHYLITSEMNFGNSCVCVYDSEDNLVLSINDTIGGQGGMVWTKEPFTIPKNGTKMIIAVCGYPEELVLEKVTYSIDYRQLRHSPLYGVKVTVIGDSITERNNTALSNWATYLEEETGCIIQNLGISGSGFYNGSPYINRIEQIDADTNIIGVAVSFNDVGHGVEIGTYKDTEATTLCGYAYQFFTQLQTNFPTTPIIVYCQCPWSSYYLGGQFGSGGTFLEEVGKMCNKMGIPCYFDMYFNGSVLRPWNVENQEIYYKNETTGVLDNTHPNSIGHKVIARYLIPKFEQNVAISIC